MTSQYFCRHLYALPFLPAEQIPAQFHKLKGEVVAVLSPSCNHMPKRHQSTQPSGSQQDSLCFFRGSEPTMTLRDGTSTSTEMLRGDNCSYNSLLNFCKRRQNIWKIQATLTQNGDLRMTKTRKQANK